MSFSIGDIVYKTRSPEMIGTIQSEPKKVGPNFKVKVRFDSGDIESVSTKDLTLKNLDEAIEDLIEASKYSNENRLLRLLLTHYKLSGKLADIVYSMEASNTDFYPYQYKPLLNFLDSPSNGLLIADEVGLGKTIEAGLILTEMIVRENANRHLIICPAVLREKWQLELRDRFGLDFQIYSAKELTRLIQESLINPNKGFKAIASYQGIRRSKDSENELDEILDNIETSDNLIDCMVLDEAHYIRNRNTSSYEAVKQLRNRAEYLFLLSATPIQTQSEDLFTLLNLIDEGTYSSEFMLNYLLIDSRHLLDASSKLKSNASMNDVLESLRAAQKSYFYKNSQQLQFVIEQIETHTNTSKLKLANLIDKTNLAFRQVNRTRKVEVFENRTKRQPETIPVPMTDEEANIYNLVTDAVRQYCSWEDKITNFLQTIPQKQLCSSIPATVLAWSKKHLGMDDTSELLEETIGLSPDIEMQSSEFSPFMSHVASAIAGSYDVESLLKNDSKYASLKIFLTEYNKLYPNKKLILFSFYRETLNYLQNRLQNDGFNSTLIVGGMKDKSTIISEFKNSDTAQILLASEVASEGVDLQFSSILINYDLPWNPMKLEQRIGRIDRIGQAEPSILIKNFIYENTLDDRIFSRLLERLMIFRSSLGDIEEILGQEIRNLERQLISHRLTPEQEAEIIEKSQQAIEQRLLDLEQVENNAIDLVAHGEFITSKAQAAHDLERFISHADLYSYINDFLPQAFPGSLIQLNESNDKAHHVRISLSVEAQAKFSAYLQKIKQGSILARDGQADCMITTKQFPTSNSQEIINQNHAFIKFIKTQIDRSERQKHNVFLFQSQNQYDLFFIIQYWSVSGIKTQEKVVFLALRTDTGDVMKFEDSEREVLTATRSQPARNNSYIRNYLDEYGALETTLDESYKNYVSEFTRQNEDYFSSRKSSIEKKYSEKIGNLQNLVQSQINAKGHPQIIRANQGKIKKLEREFEFNLKKLDELNQSVRSSNKLIAAGLILGTSHEK